MSNRYSFLPPGEGTNYDWENDHTFVKITTGDTAGAYTLMEDNLKSTFALGLHRHDHHAETFYILEGALDFYIDGDWIAALPGTTLHVPPGVPHACRVANKKPARMLMIFQPAGFDEFLAELGKMKPEDFEDTAIMEALNAKYDIVSMGPVPAHPND